MRYLKIFAILLLLGTAAQAQDPMFTAATNYLKVFGSATSWEELLPYVSKDTAAAIASMPAENKARVFTFYQKLQQAVAGTGEMEVAERSVEGDRATLTLQIVGARPTDDFQGQKILLVRENGEWKVDISKVVRAMGQTG